MRRITFALLTTCLLCSCGQRGNLYLPDNQPEAIPAASPAAADTTSTTPEERDANARNRRSN